MSTNDTEKTKLVDAKLAEFESTLSETERRAGILYVNKPLKIEEYLSLTEDEISKLSYHECSTIRWSLTQHSLYVQKMINRANAIKFWSSRNLDIVVSQEIEYDGTFFKHEVIRDKIIKRNSYAKALHDIFMNEQAKIEILNNTAQLIKDVSLSINNIMYSKKDEAGKNVNN